MKQFLSILLLTALASLLPSTGSAQDDYTFFFRQIQMPDEAQWDVGVEQEGSQQSPLAINPNGARFELWTIKADPLTSYLLDTTYVNSYVPVASVNIKTEDPYEVIPRTRADRPFEVELELSGLSSDPDAPEAAKSVKILRHVQAYSGNGSGKNVNRSNATLLSQGSLSSNGTHLLSYAVTSIPGGDRSKVRGEERFSVFSMEDYQAPESQLASEFMQVWPVADGTIEGMADGDVITETVPDIKVTLNDLYPDSYTYVQVYQGPQALGTEGTIIPGASYLLDASKPKNTKIIHVRDWDEIVGIDGQYTLEVITITPFGADRLGYLNFITDRTIEVRGSVTSLE